MSKRVVITGMGVISPIGIGLADFWESLTAGVSGIARITRFDPSEYSTQIAGEVKDFDYSKYLDKKEGRRMDKFSQYAVVAAAMALEDAGLDLAALDKDRTGVIVGSGIGGMETFEEQCRVLVNRGPGRISPFLIPMMIANIAAGQIAIKFGLRGPNITTITACASSGNAIGDAYKLIQRGGAETVITGGTEAPITPLSVAGFCAMKAMSTRNQEPARASRPFDADRDGFVMGEGAAMLVLETLEHAQRRGAKIYAEIVGYGSSCDAYHITAPDPEGAGAAAAMQMALADGGLKPEDVQYINAHGTSTPVGDTAEVTAIKRVFGEHAYKLTVSSTKSMTGHMLGAAGAVESVASVLAIVHDVVPPTINLENPDPACDLDFVPHQARRMPVQVALSNSFGFGGHNVTLAFKKFRP
ncbi:beta-ketoacyl-ACP synthase II [Desulforamulus hydrothermalis]|uniref:3-oxoacyl-[acyl-carrier-protein] synthase 2 n=1 Tax=Desulforamulus hydrothermalis Lam5 = DSM 18033 TaxID=1121428 RepID=K8EIQ9_9FIRM|nr:beta-ketoacyl-ACP synthase II [Desulforamulus hydrothermalis]CCO08496.1 3-oxoacyl-(acyl-carrier-protein) synthase 2 [Desulforamulus hydrothermalis Lam5 = DSM 18033]SHH29591.1 3-oxoacyl-[acyl-carrier-protein] synthase II [Desulforamulus hydrothermalis Lam5 = DSM 18033]